MLNRYKLAGISEETILTIGQKVERKF